MRATSDARWWSYVSYGKPMGAKSEMTRSPRRLAAQRRSRSRSRELSRLRTQLNGKGKSLCLYKYVDMYVCT